MDDAGVVSLQATMADMGRTARAGARALRLASPEQRTAAIRAMAAEIRAAAPAILAANAQDLARAEANGVSGPMLDRLALDAARLEGVAVGVEAVAEIADPLGVATSRWTRPNGLDISRVRTPIGVIAMIYESRPNVTADAAALCVRSGNAVILRGGSECIASNLAIHTAIERGLLAAGLPASAVQAVKTPDRAAVGMILQGLDRSIDLIIPRGGKSLVARVQAEARAPVLGHLEGLNHVFVDAAADPKKAVDIVVNAKLRRVSVCGSAETLLVDKAAAETLLPLIAEALIAAGCELRGDDAARAIVPAMKAATTQDWTTEYLAAILSVAVVDGVEGAAAHIAAFGSGHTDAIVTEDETVAEAFVAAVDSAIVLVNASTQFADGGEFGFGAEIGIATDKLHARGPVGAEQLTTFKYVVRGTGQTRP
ncbi:glutamate-5-semialdehyde dehydrogenase [Caulobacter sp. BP25]|uniref:glutamate-5-semialdehyde dehydrogenase n=1 Tax=Caulobacter sp. BP25 TaxID=2048900 RepID=UPI000C12B7DF|nr:glutamate-5-semialdehyde dehydrogenase [Caulobacter sp. BP25]PHY17933.1 glutamate-5-semialdehyde dehydrogenase [Caulobacter sp. BP25]